MDNNSGNDYDNNYNGQSFNGGSQTPLNPMAQQLGTVSGQQSDPMAGQTYGQGQAYGQPPYDKQPFTPQRPTMVYQPTGLPGVQPGVSPTLMPGGTSKPPKKKGPIVAICVIMVLAVAAVLCIFVFKLPDKLFKKSASSPEAAGEAFLEALSNLDKDAILKTMPEEYSTGKYVSVVDSFMSDFDTMKDYDFEIRDIKAVKRKDLDVEGIKANAKAKLDIDLDITEAASVTASGYVHIKILGEEVNDNFALDLTCGKIGDKWYVVDVHEPDDNPYDTETVTTENDTFSSEPTEYEDTTEADDTTEEKETTEAKDTAETKDTTEADDTTEKSTTESAYVPPANVERKYGKPEDLPDSMNDLTIYIDGELYTLIAPYLPEGFGISSTDYAQYDPNRELDAGKYDYSSYPIVSSKYEDADFYAYVMYCNPTGQKIKLKDAYVQSISFSKSYSGEGKKIPEVVLPKGVTWGTKAEDIKKAYGEPDYIYGEDDEDSEYISYSYYLKDESDDSWYTDSLYFWLSKKDGLEEISITCNTWEK
ncbi:MAG: DUF1720 domain-containing protein [Lachnospiraceae bacterium]|nr:DUF1720 domain-containing protein [Lachnospiraceae bacterium]